MYKIIEDKIFNLLNVTSVTIFLPVLVEIQLSKVCNFFLTLPNFMDYAY